MIIETIALTVLFGGAACVIAIIGLTKEKLDERLFGEEQESNKW